MGIVKHPYFKIQLIHPFVIHIWQVQQLTYVSQFL